MSELSKIQKFDVSLGRAIAYGLIPLLVMGLVFTATIAVTENDVRTDVTPEFKEMVINNEKEITKGLAQSIDNDFSTLQVYFNLITQRAETIFEINKSSEGRNYYVDAAEIDQPVLQKYSERLNLTVDESVSSFFVYPNTTTTSNFTDTINHLLNLTRSFDPLFSSIYQSVTQLLWIDMVFTEGVVKQFPYYRHKVASFDPLNHTWYNSSVQDTSDPSLYFSDTGVDEFTNRHSIIISYPLIVKGSLKGVIKFSYGLSNVDNDLKSFSEFNTQTMILDNASNVVSFSGYNFGLFGWNTSETNNTLVDLNADAAEYFNASIPTQEFILIDDVFYIFTPMNFTGLFLVKTGSLSFGTVYADFNPVDLYLYPGIIILVTAVIFIGFLRRYGFLAGVTIDDIVDLVDKIPDDGDLQKLASDIASGEIVDSLVESAADKIKEEGSELRDKITDKVEEMTVDRIKEAVKDYAEDKAEQVESKFTDAIESKLNKVEGLVDKAEGVEEKLEVMADPNKSLEEKAQELFGEEGSFGDKFGYLVPKAKELSGIIGDPQAYVRNKIGENIMSLATEELLKSDIGKLDKMLALFSKGGDIQVEEFANAFNYSPEGLLNLVSSLNDPNLKISEGVFSISPEVLKNPNTVTKFLAAIV